jgi:RHS repeat-associated protein
LRTTSLDNAFNVTDGPAGHLSVGLVVPSAIRPGGGGIVRVDYTNDGGTDLAAPVIDLIAAGALINNAGIVTDEVTFLATDPEGPAGVLAPGAQGSVTFSFSSTNTLNFIKFSLRNLSQSEATIDWSALEETLRPEFVDPAGWEHVWNQFITQVGSTSTSLLMALAEDATALAQIGQPTSDVAALLQLELLEASGVLPKKYLVVASDLMVSGPGLDLQLSRAYDGSLLSRSTGGIFGEGWKFTYDVAAFTDANGNVTIVRPDGTNFFVRQADGQFTSQSGDASTLSLVEGNLVLSSLDGSVVQFHSDGTLHRITDPSGNSISADWDATGHLVQLTHSGGQFLSFTYNSFGRVETATDSNGRVVGYAYDSTGAHLIAVESASGTTEYEYHPADGSPRENALLSVTRPDGTHHFFEYDLSGRLSAEQGDGGSGRIEYSYDVAGQVVVTDAFGNQSKLLYDALGNIVQIEDALGRVTQLTRDSIGQVSDAVTPTNGIHTYAYDSLGNLVEHSDPLNASVGAFYASGTSFMTGFTDQRGNTILYSYDASGHLTGLSYEDASGSQYQYSSLGLLEIATNARGQQTNYEYDSSGRLISKTFGDGTAEHFAYDAHGNLTSATTRDGGEALYTYDSADRLTSVTDINGHVQTYAYDDGGRLVEHVKPDGSVTAYGYDVAGRLAEVRDGAGDLLVSYEYDAAGRVVRTEMGNGASTTVAFNSVGEVTEIVDLDSSGNVIGRSAYTYNADSRVVAVETLAGNWSYEYDAAGQLTHAVFDAAIPSISDQDLFYSYDSTGNRIRSVENGVVTEYTANELNQYVRVGDTTYTYDLDGNLTGKSSGAGTWAYTFDEEGQLIGVDGPDGVWVFEYDALGNRVASIRDGERSEYAIEPFAESIIQEIDAAGAAIASYTYGLGLEARSDATGDLEFFHTDRIGNVVGLSGENGLSSGSYTYDPFGEIILIEGDSANPFLHSGELGVVRDESGLELMRARYYEPELGRFVSRDATGIAGGANLYVYALNDPTNGVDPSGDIPVFVFTGIAGAVGGAISYAIVNNATGDFSWAGLAGAAVSGGITGAAAGVLGPAALGGVSGAGVGAVSSAAGNAVEQWLGGKEFNWGDLVADTAIGAATGAIPLPDLPGIPGVTKGRNSWEAIYKSTVTKLTNGTIENVSFKTFLKSIGAEIPGGIADEFVGGLFEDLLESFVQFIRASDPNDIVGPEGFGDEHFVTAGSALPYTINFENQPSATAPAQHIVITQQLDADLDPRTFRLTGFGFDDQQVTLPGNRAFLSQRIDLTETKGFFVDVTATVDVATGIITWTFDTIDPATGEAPLDPTIGLLPINDETHRGEGFVSYTVRPKAGVPTGTVIDAQARIIFDTEEPIDTPAIFNTIDSVKPSSQVNALPAQTGETTFEVSWGGTDDESGSAIADFTILVSRDGEAPTVWLSRTTLTNGLFTGDAGHTYAFYSVARDNAGNEELAPATADAVVQVTGGETNTAPTDIALTAETVAENSAPGTIVAEITATDADEDETFTFTLLDDADGRFAIDGGNLVVAGTLDRETDDAHSVTIRVTDSANNVFEETFTIGVANVNEAPVVATPIDDQAVAEDNHWSFEVPAGFVSDVDTATLAFTATLGDDTPLPGWLSFDAQTRTFSGMPPANYHGDIVLKVTASDGEFAVSDTFTLTVTPVNDDPVITSNGGGATAQISRPENSLAVTTVVANDNDQEQTVRYRIAGGADSLRFSINVVTGALAFALAPDFDTPGDADGDNTYDVVVEAYDGEGGVDAQALAVTVTNIAGVTIIGTNGNDVVNASQTVPGQPFPTDEDDSISGRSGNDIINARGGRDTILGEGGNDTLNGEAGDDVLTGGIGTDVMDGGEDSDTYRVAAGDGTDTFVDTGTTGFDRVIATTNNVTFTFTGFGAGNGIEEISANGFTNVTIVGTSAANTLDFSSTMLTGIAFVDAGGGNDTVIGSVNVDNIRGGAGTDSLSGGLGADILVGRAGNDTLDGGQDGDVYQFTRGEGFDVYADTGTTGIDKIVLQANGSFDMTSFGPSNGIDEINANGFTGVFIAGTTVANTLDFSATTLVGVTYIDGGDGSDTVTGSAGADTLYGGFGADTLRGGAGADTMIGAQDNDVLDGGEDGDTYQDRAGDGFDTYADTGTAGTDRVVATAAGALDLTQFAVTSGIEEISSNGFAGVYILGSDGGDSLNFSATTFTGFDRIDGASGNDTLTGTQNADRINGGTGLDVIDGAGGNDTLTGGSSADTMRGGAGSDSILGQSGTDRFIWTTTDGTGDGQGSDVVDANAAELERLEFDALLLQTLRQADGTTLAHGESILTGSLLGGGLGSLARSDSTHLLLDWDGDGLADLAVQFAGPVNALVYNQAQGALVLA